MREQSSEVLKTRTDFGTDTYPPSFVGHTNCVRAIKNPASKERELAL